MIGPIQQQIYDNLVDGSYIGPSGNPAIPNIMLKPCHLVMNFDTLTGMIHEGNIMPNGKGTEWWWLFINHVFIPINIDQTIAEKIVDIRS